MIQCSEVTQSTSRGEYGVTTHYRADTPESTWAWLVHGLDYSTVVHVCYSERHQKSSVWERHLVYPLSFLLLLSLTCVSLFMVSLNILTLILGLSHAPVGAQVSSECSSSSLGCAWGPIRWWLIIILSTHSGSHTLTRSGVQLLSWTTRSSSRGGADNVSLLYYTDTPLGGACCWFTLYGL